MPPSEPVPTPPPSPAAANNRQPPSAVTGAGPSATTQTTRQPGGGGSTGSSISPPTSPPYSSSPPPPSASNVATTQTIPSPSTPDSLAQPPSRTSPPSNAEDQQPALKYSVASHSVRITKNGFAIDPVELRYPEIIQNISTGARRASDVSFDGGQTAHKVLSLIRGFWSQPGFPRGKPVRNDKLNSISSLLNEFAQYPLYPHEETLGSWAKARPKAPPRRIKRIVARQAAAKSSTADLANQSDESRTRAMFGSDPKTSSPPLTTDGSRTSRTGSDILSLFISKQTKSPPPIGPTRPAIRSTNTFHSWIPKNKDQVHELVTKLLDKMERIFSQEARIIQVGSPCTVLGDIHGNLNDLRTYERSLWPRAPNCLTSNYLFLGDYVDRGEYSVECVLYLFAMKCLTPQRFYLLRGNHEVAAIQRQYTFGRECETKFGSYGRDLWLAFNKVFDLMPVAAVIDNQIFCAHGGIPRAVSDIRALAEEIPSPLDNPEQQCPAAWEILWNDPITDSELIGMIEMDNAVPTTAIQIGQPATPSPPPVAPPKPSAPAPAPASAVSQVASKTTDKEKDRDKEADSKSDIDDFNAAMNRTLTAGIASYIKPETTSQQPLAKAVDEAKSVAKENKPNNGQDQDNNKLRKVPSDTSSIASSSPQQIINDGFIANIKRGTAFLFSDQAVTNFLKLNRLSHVIRAHEVIPTGFAFHGEGRVITIFSSSKYCGLNNQAACALVEREKIRILRLDTGDAGE